MYIRCKWYGMVYISKLMILERVNWAIAGLVILPKYSSGGLSRSGGTKRGLFPTLEFGGSSRSLSLPSPSSCFS